MVFSIVSKESGLDIRFMLPEKSRFHGLGARICLKCVNRDINVAIGYTDQTSDSSQYKFVKIFNSINETWIDVSYGVNDLLSVVQREYSGYISGDDAIGAYVNPKETSDIRIFLSTSHQFENDAIIQIEKIWIWEESNKYTGWGSNWDSISSQGDHALDLIKTKYIKQLFVSSDLSAEKYLKFGVCPINYGRMDLEWGAYENVPFDLNSSDTYRFSWNALHPVLVLLKHYYDTGDIGLVFSIREFLSNWLRDNYYSKSDDAKYPWYDHSVADRQIAFVLIWQIGLKLGFEYRFMQRLHSAIFHHACLLNSEFFYAYNQKDVRFHNHAMFQDIALLLTSIVMGHIPYAKQWQDNSSNRLKDIFSKIIRREDGCAISVENSIGYHVVSLTFVDTICSLFESVNIEYNNLFPTKIEIERFTEFFTYSNGLQSSQGDTFRVVQPRENFRIIDHEHRLELIVFRESGYAFAYGLNDNINYQFNFYSTSQSSTHKHEDNLSFTLYFNEIEWFIDPSFFSHDYENPIPVYLRSARAHNVIALDNIKYSVFPGLSSIDGTANEEIFTISGVHKCYAGYTVSRRVNGCFNKLDLNFEEMVGLDGIQPDNGVSAFLMLHCGEGVVVNRIGEDLLFSHRNSVYSLKVKIDNVGLRVFHGHLGSGSIRGIAGHGFSKYQEINTVEVEIPLGQKFLWSISAIKTK
jgi:hypothetical protein